jgi:hypothetical protein
MPRPKKPARLWKDKKGGWIILDAGKQRRTGYSGDSGRGPAEEALSRYLAQKLSIPDRPLVPDEAMVSDVLVYYTPSPAEAGFDDLTAGLRSIQLCP